MRFFSSRTCHCEPLIAAAQMGDPMAFRQLYENTHQKLFAYAAARVSDREDAIDLVQDTFIDLWRSLPEFEYHSDQAFMGFLFIILKRKLAHYYTAKQYTTKPLVEIADETAVTEKVRDEYGLTSLLSQLRPEYAEVLRLRYWSSLSFNEISVIMKKKLNTIKTWHRRALEEMHNLLEHHA